MLRLPNNAPGSAWQCHRQFLWGQGPATSTQNSRKSARASRRAFSSSQLSCAGALPTALSLRPLFGVALCGLPSGAVGGPQLPSECLVAHSLGTSSVPSAHMLSVMALEIVLSQIGYQGSLVLVKRFWGQHNFVYCV